MGPMSLESNENRPKMEDPFCGGMVAPRVSANAEMPILKFVEFVTGDLGKSRSARDSAPGSYIITRDEVRKFIEDHPLKNEKYVTPCASRYLY